MHAAPCAPVRCPTPAAHLQVGTFRTPLSDGWGITNDGPNFVLSDGSNRLTWVDPSTWQRVKSVTVTDQGRTIGWLNEVRRHRPARSPPPAATRCTRRAQQAPGGRRSPRQRPALPREGAARRGTGVRRPPDPRLLASCSWKP